MEPGPLLVFDFDHTITDLNTDVEVQKLAPGGEIPASSEMRGLYSDKGWTEFMGAVFALLHENDVSKVSRGTEIEMFLSEYSVRMKYSR